MWERHYCFQLAKDLFEGYKTLTSHVPNMLNLKKYERSKFQDNKSPNFGTPTGESWNKMPFRLTLTES
jgi:hypothetical protein